MPKPEKIRARITGRRKSSSIRIERTIWFRRESWVHWYLEITDGKKVINRDDCRDLAKLHQQATEKVRRMRELAASGHKFKSWADLVDEARA